MNRITAFSMKTLIALALLTMIASCAMGQTPSQTDTLLLSIRKMQVRTDDFYFAGAFPTYRRYGGTGCIRKDNDVFFTGLIAFTLKQLSGKLTAEEQRICDSIIRLARTSYGHFRNTGGLPTFNFWTTDPPVVFPNSWFLNHFNEADKLPDDLDDTAILWLSMDAPDSVVEEVKKLMGLHANGQNGHWIRNTYRQYRQLPAYSTWFGVKMPVDFDFCVLCNVLYFVRHYKLPFNEHDLASIEMLTRMIVSGEYVNRAAYISPHYGRTPLLLYHVARLLGAFSIPALDTLKPRLLAEARRQYGKAGNWLDSVLLSTAVMRLGGDPLPVPAITADGVTGRQASFFVASFSALMPDVWKRLLLHNQFIKYYFFCPAYRYTLYLENLVLRRAAGLKRQGLSTGERLGASQGRP